MFKLNRSCAFKIKIKFCLRYYWTKSKRLIRDIITISQKLSETEIKTDSHSAFIKFTQGIRRSTRFPLLRFFINTFLNDYYQK